ncbi:uncharacterized protein CMU_001390 [Cryptosporidium muris RN66]|uniref:Uncharacterized protein n=1 Tax=Cryptosporidium muris (strain RN66) TaxID=441375 RepID=B6AGC7_CRYMR|nr:uncharacterized protein CMU_001390 [Cryptosporidium muris RN66]EEA07268.1 hypothetical protein, conserved [Cryptosporidium muris RN66]|eukprot:XP_002141617.1 hypothetical protein [Cryptosporidium muris RN66]
MTFNSIKDLNNETMETELNNSYDFELKILKCNRRLEKIQKYIKEKSLRKKQLINKIKSPEPKNMVKFDKYSREISDSSCDEGLVEELLTKYTEQSLNNIINCNPNIYGDNNILCKHNKLLNSLGKSFEDNQNCIIDCCGNVEINNCNTSYRDNIPCQYIKSEECDMKSPCIQNKIFNFKVDNLEKLQSIQDQYCTNLLCPKGKDLVKPCEVCLEDIEKVHRCKCKFDNIRNSSARTIDNLEFKDIKDSNNCKDSMISKSTLTNYRVFSDKLSEIVPEYKLFCWNNHLFRKDNTKEINFDKKYNEAEYILLSLSINPPFGINSEDSSLLPHLCSDREVDALIKFLDLKSIPNVGKLYCYFARKRLIRSIRLMSKDENISPTIKMCIYIDEPENLMLYTIGSAPVATKQSFNFILRNYITKIRISRFLVCLILVYPFDLYKDIITLTTTDRVLPIYLVELT